MDPTQSHALPGLKTMLKRGWRKKCPQCGQGDIYKRWLTLHERCSHCGLQYLTNQGDLFGPLVFLDRVLFLIPFITIFYFRIWHPNLFVFLIAGCVMLCLFIFTLPNRNGVSLAFDYYLRRRGGHPPEANPSTREQR